jgi:hypothetical protein
MDWWTHQVRHASAAREARPARCPPARPCCCKWPQAPAGGINSLSIASNTAGALDDVAAPIRLRYRTRRLCQRTRPWLRDGIVAETQVMRGPPGRPSANPRPAVHSAPRRSRLPAPAAAQE